ncbi:MAG: ABC transporter permease [Candidatus Levyibacteriota bacterium]
MNYKTRQTLSLIMAFAIAEFKLRNEGSYLGLFWYLLSPILTFILLFFIFSTRLGATIADFPLYLLMGIILFNFFQFTTTESTKVIQNYRGVIRSIYFPREVLVGQLVLKTFFSHIFEMLLFVLLMLFFHMPLWGLFYYPFILVLLAFFTMGVSLILCALTVYVSDLENVWSFATRLLWFATPIFYAQEGVPGISILNKFNPMYYFITVAREMVIYQHIPEPFLILGVIVYTITPFICGIWIFKLLKDKFAEMI